MLIDTQVLITFGGEEYEVFVTYDADFQEKDESVGIDHDTYGIYVKEIYYVDSDKEYDLGFLYDNEELLQALYADLVFRISPDDLPEYAN
jgi:hypothetical protein